MKMHAHANEENPRMILVSINDSPNGWDGTDVIRVGNFEAWNFRPIEGHYYGAIPESGRINLVRLGGGTTDAFVNDVTVVWVVKKKTIVGWYLNATVFRKGQDPPPANKYRATCLVQNGRLLDELDRTFDVKAEGARFGQYPRFYPDAVKDCEFIDRVKKYIEKMTSNPGTNSTP